MSTTQTSSSPSEIQPCIPSQVGQELLRIGESLLKELGAMRKVTRGKFSRRTTRQPSCDSSTYSSSRSRTTRRQSRKPPIPRFVELSYGISATLAREWMAKLLSDVHANLEFPSKTSKPPDPWVPPKGPLTSSAVRLYVGGSGTPSRVRLLAIVGTTELPKSSVPFTLTLPSKR